MDGDILSPEAVRDDSSRHCQGHLLGSHGRVEPVDGDDGAIGEGVAGKALEQRALGAEAVEQQVVPGPWGG